MHVITERRLRGFWQNPDFADSERPLRTWLRIMRAVRYTDSHAVRQDFSSASFLGDHRTVFNIGGNKYRLVVDMRYDLGRVYVRQVLTHEEYDRRAANGSL